MTTSCSIVEKLKKLRNFDAQAADLGRAF